MTSLSLNKFSFYEILVTICILLSPILSNYVFISEVSFGDAMVFVTLPWLFSQLRLSTSTIFHILISLAIVFTSYVLLGDISVYAGFYRAAFFYCIIFLIVCIKNFNLPHFSEMYGSVCVIASLLIVFQWCAYVGFDLSIPLQLPFKYYEPDTLKVIDHVFRAGGLFKEPSYYAIYVMPYFVFIASREGGAKFFIISLAGILSTSSLMFFLIAMCFVLLCLRVFSFCGVLVAILSTMAFGAILFTNGFFDGYVFIDRVHSILTDGGTLNDRFLPLFDIVSASDFFMPSVEALSFFLSSNLWFNSASSTIAYFGVGGLSFLILISYKFQLLFRLLFLMLLFMTHFMSTAFSYFIAIAFVIFGDRFVVPLRK